jgi:hypothetical protein
MRILCHKERAATRVRVHRLPSVLWMSVVCRGIQSRFPRASKILSSLEELAKAPREGTTSGGTSVATDCISVVVVAPDNMVGPHYSRVLMHEESPMVTVVGGWADIASPPILVKGSNHHEGPQAHSRRIQPTNPNGP